jgi:FkbM family methyltransferase
VSAVTKVGPINWHYRRESSDRGIIEQVFENNACRLPDDLTGRVFMDIGAHIGAASVLAALRGAKVFAFEPFEESRRLLEATAAAAKLDITSLPYAIGEPGVMRLYTDPYNTGQNSAFLMYPELSADRFVYVVSISYTDAVALTASPDFLKVDCEGSEPFVLHDLWQRQEKPQTISVEFHRPDRMQMELFQKIYDVKQISNDGYVLERR